MCQIIVKEAGKKFNMKHLNVAQTWNKDGYGVSWWENEKLETFLTMDFNRFKAILTTLKRFKAVAHMRNTTRGDTCLDNNHPFDIPSGKLFHNGTIYGLTCSAEGGSDTQALADLINACSYDYIDSILPFIKHTVGDKLNKLVFFEDNGEVTFVNKHLGMEENGIWYSNNYHTKAKPVYTPYVSVSQATRNYDEETGTYTKGTTIPAKTLSNTKVFVYGTLKEGYHSHDTFLKFAKKLGSATSVGKWAMIGAGLPFPHLLGRDHVNGLKIIGEVYEVTPIQLESLDRLEGCPTHYKQEDIYVAYADNKPSENVRVYVKAMVTEMDKAQPYIAEFQSTRRLAK